ncbi:MAG: hypothetical protein B9S33_21520 [Pedosphaera sp. Tous-C6FEB]|nr:MAG: hypothetical protein B9S33_21520 [Pedosphaera sp. Tous-C6FEB]
MREHRVRALLMGGQACVFYGAAEFSRDTDFAILASAANLARLKRALAALRAELIAVPPFAVKFLLRGHALHFRCQHPEAAGLRVDVMTRMRGVEPFSKLWKRRTTLTLSDGLVCDLLSLPDLVQAKKTQRDKDWPMLRRLVEAHYFEHRARPSSAQVRFWLQELRTAELLCDTARGHGALARRMVQQRPLLKLALRGDAAAVQAALAEEELCERTADTAYWKPLRAELEALRHARLK